MAERAAAEAAEAGLPAAAAVMMMMAGRYFHQASRGECCLAKPARAAQLRLPPPSSRLQTKQESCRLRRLHLLRWW